ncbi:hypothetical protein PVAND_009489 [Polypedilum vanderplanki]|uniref:Uncharacterized protein n=1 Tax=Polypedilum vanderplanki TaxID=319348 RepID=A0A9J6CD26_POLVA|nr:hypothetical protein PVAND_009489 [Polypedilum vanderplanki]
MVLKIVICCAVFGYTIILLNAGGPRIDLCDIINADFNNSFNIFSQKISEIKLVALNTIINYEQENATQEYMLFMNTLRNLSLTFTNEISNQVSNIINIIEVLIPELSHDEIKEYLIHNKTRPYPLSCIDHFYGIIKISNSAKKAIADQAFLAIDGHEYQ